MKNYLPVLASICLVSCTSVPQSPPEPVVRTVEVKVQVPVPCAVRPVPRPTYEFDVVDAAAEFDRHVAALLADRLQREQTERLLRAALDACTEVPK